MTCNSRNRFPRACGSTRHSGVIFACSAALLGACTLDTDPEAPATQAPLQADVQDEPEDRVAVSTSNVDDAAASPSAASADATSAAPQDAPADTPAQTETAAAANMPKQDAPAEHDKSTPEKGETQASGPMKPAAADAPQTAKADAHAAACREGKYSGVISGTVTLTGIFELGTMAGTIDVDLAADSAHADRLLVRSGRLKGVDDKHNVFSADLTGTFSCTPGELVQTAVERGKFGDAILDSQISFTGATKGQYSADPPALLGTWEISDDTALLAGQGTWTAALSPAP